MVAVFSVHGIPPLMLTFDKSWNTLCLVGCRGEVNEENTDGFIAGDTRSSGAEDPAGRPHPRLGHSPADPAGLAGRAARRAGVALPGAPPAGGAGLDQLRVGGFGQ